MAGDWIKVEMATPDKPEVDQIASILKIDPDAVTGKLLRFWIWADNQSISGHALNVTKTLIDRVTYCPGFADALLKVDWLQARSGSFTIPHFDRHNGQSAKNRALATERQRKSRKERDKCHGKTVTKTLPEKRREEKSIKKVKDKSFTKKNRADSFEEVAEYCSSINLPKSDAEWLWDHWEENDWTRMSNGKREKIKSWRLVANNWKRQLFFPSQKQSAVKRVEHVKATTPDTGPPKPIKLNMPEPDKWEHLVPPEMYKRGWDFLCRSDHDTVQRVAKGESVVVDAADVARFEDFLKRAGNA